MKPACYIEWLASYGLYLIKRFSDDVIVCSTDNLVRAILIVNGQIELPKYIC